MEIHKADDLQMMMENYQEAYECENYTTALKHLAKAELYTKEKQDVYRLSEVKFITGIMYERLSNYGQALHYYNQALSLLQDKKFHKERISIINNIANLYASEKNYTEALFYYQQNYQRVKYSKEKDDIYLKIVSGINVARNYNAIGKYTEALKYLQEIKEQALTSNFAEQWKVSHARALFIKGDLKKSKKILKRLMPAVDKQNEVECYICITDLLVDIYEEQDSIAQAINYMRLQGPAKRHSLHNQINFYKNFSRLFYKQKAYAIANRYQDSIIFTKDILEKVVNRDLFEMNMVKLEINEYKNQILLEKEKQKEEQIAFGLIFLIFLLVLAFIYILYKNRLNKAKNRQTTLHDQQLITELELNQLKSKIEKKNTRLLSKEHYIRGKNTILKEILDKLIPFKQKFQDPTFSRHIQFLKQKINSEQEWDNFVYHFEKVNPKFIDKLKEKHPELTSKDIRFLCYLYLNLDKKELSDLYHITHNAVRKKINRLRKKMNINDKRLSIENYLINL
ncbi:tetratricopeptide repeat protein [Mesonia aquimarina]|uniref:tetratricopeptide repeat protein n=1 Tax=Mesonia aquimarina TaxID=1504967 RepID=UPI000EF5C3B2|nr:tetratricopeptide repeat protein [Mesonia aquimarina]